MLHYNSRQNMRVCKSVSLICFWNGHKYKKVTKCSTTDYSYTCAVFDLLTGQGLPLI